MLTLEPFLHLIRANQNIKQISVRDREHKVSVFVDDVPLFLSDPQMTLPNLIRDLENVHTILNLKINYAKSFALNISIPFLNAKLNFPDLGVYSLRMTVIPWLPIHLPPAFFLDI